MPASHRPGVVKRTSLTLRLPDGQTEPVRYRGNVPPTVILAPDPGPREAQPQPRPCFTRPRFTRAGLTRSTTGGAESRQAETYTLMSANADVAELSRPDVALAL